MKKWAAIVIGGMLIVSLSACGGNKQGAGTATPAPGATAGGATGGTAGGGAAGGAGGTAANVDVQAVYKQNCISCHGDNLEGKLGPNTNLTAVGGRKTREQIAAQITNGGNGMMAFKGKLKDEEIGALADWLASKK